MKTGVIMAAALLLAPARLAAQQPPAGEWIDPPLRAPVLFYAQLPSPPDQEPAAWQAALASLVVPGSGQIWSGRRWGWALVGLEGALVVGGVWSHRTGRRLQNDYERFADQWWDRQRLFDYLSEYESSTGTPWPHDHHTLPPEGVRNHDYYEMIGKYDQFAPGWADWTPGQESLYRGSSGRRTDYLGRRLRANRHLARALTAGGLIFLNHVGASIEVLLRDHHRRRTALRLQGAWQVDRTGGGPIPGLRLVVEFEP